MALRVLTVVLNRGKTQQQLPESVEHDYLGGRGAIAWLLVHHLSEDTAPLSADNLLIFAAGPLAGTATVSSGGFVVGTRSPLTGGIGYSWAQGRWGAALRRSGHDLLVIRGQAEQWCYLQVDGNSVRVRSAAHLLGQDTRTTVETIQGKLGSDYVVACIGPAGEARVAYSSIVAEGRYLAEPAGTGAIMAHKRIKAIAVRDGAPLPVADERKLQVAHDVIARRVAASPDAQSIQQIGSLHYFDRAVATGAITTHNGQHGNLSAELAGLGASVVRQGQAEQRRATPLLMPADCADVPTDHLLLPDLECVAGFGANCGITQPAMLLNIFDQCVQNGLDPVATSAAIAFMMECQQQQLSMSDALPWGDGDAVLAAIERLSQHQEKRDVLSLGVDEMKEIFYGSANFAPQVKGLAIPNLDPRALTEVALALATSPIGGDYRYAMSYEELLDTPPPWLPDEPALPRATEGKVNRLIWHERLAAVLDSAGIDRRLGLMAYQISPGEAIALISAATGQTLSGAEMARLGERIVTLERLFTLQQCYNGGTDELPRRWQETPLEEGPAAGHLPDLQRLLGEYYSRRGWDNTGIPFPERLTELGIQ